MNRYRIEVDVPGLGLGELSVCAENEEEAKTKGLKLFAKTIPRHVREGYNEIKLTIKGVEKDTLGGADTPLTPEKEKDLNNIFEGMIERTLEESDRREPYRNN